MTLDWRPSGKDGGLWGYSGEVIVAMVGRRMIHVDADGQRHPVDAPIWWWRVEGAYVRHRAKSKGESKTQALAVRAASRAWSLWLQDMQLQPIPKTAEEAREP